MTHEQRPQHGPYFPEHRLRRMMSNEEALAVIRHETAPRNLSEIEKGVLLSSYRLPVARFKPIPRLSKTHSRTPSGSLVEFFEDTQSREIVCRAARQRRAA